MTTISTIFTENDTASFECDFTDELGVAVTPNLIKWKLTNLSKVVINSRNWVTVTPATSIKIVLSGADLGIAGDFDEWRVLTVYCEYDSSYGSDLPKTYEYKFKIEKVLNEYPL